MQVRRAGLVAVLLGGCALSACGLWSDVGDAGCDGGATGPGGVVGFDRSTGEERWTMAIGSPDGAVVVDDVLVVSTTTEVVRGIEIGTGDVVWCMESESDFEDAGGVVSAGPFVATLANGDVVALDPATGVEQWRRRVATSESRLSGGDVVWVSDGSAAGGMLAALDGATGADVPDASGPPRAASFMLGDAPIAAGGFDLDAVSGGGGMEQGVTVTVSSQSQALWSTTVPGFVAALVESSAGPLVLVLDQTGGTGTMPPGRFDTRLTAYAAGSGEQLWQVPLPGTPHVIAPVSSEVVVVPNGTEMHAIDPSSGAALWTVDMPSPGQGGSYDEPGGFWFAAGGDGTAAVAVGYAERPYRD